MPHRSLNDYIAEFEQHGRSTAYVQPQGFRAERWSYAQMAVISRQFARELETRGISKGERVLIWGPNCAEWVAAFYGCSLRGVVVVPMDDAASPDFARRVYGQTGARLAVCGGRHGEYFPDAETMRLEDLRKLQSERSREPYKPESLERDDPLQIIFTSGTTAEPRGVVISHGNVLANIVPLEHEMAKYLKYERWVHPVRFLNLLPLSHVFGQFLGMYLPPLMRGAVVVQASLSPTEVIRSIRRERVSVLVAVPRVLQSLREKLERDLEAEGKMPGFRQRFKQAAGRHFLQRWWMFRDIRRRFGWKFWAMISGGATLDRETEEFWGRLGYAVVQGYGLTETTSLISVNHPFHLGQGSVGKVLAGREVKLAEDGEILVRGGGVASAYWSGQEMRPVAAEEGWYGTGDIGALDAGGNLYFRGRKKNVIVTAAGMNVHPEDLEAALRAQPEVQDCVVVGLEAGDPEPCAVLILRAGADAEQLVQLANQSLAEYQRMRRWFVWPEKDFPRTSTQKPRTSLIREAVEAGAAAAPAPGGPLGELIAGITGRPSQELAGFANLDADLNLTSLDRVALMGALEDRYQLDLNETSFAAVNTAGDLERLLRGQVAARTSYHYPRWTLRRPIAWLRLLAHYILVRPAVYLLGWPRIRGRENLHGVAGPVLVICNHIDDVDVGFVQTALPGRIRHRLATATGGEALEALRTPPPSRAWPLRAYDCVRWALGVALLNLFPLPRAAGFRDSFAYAGECVDRGYSVLIFPEGHHTTDGRLRPFRAGAGLLARNLGVPVVPMRIDGLFEVKQAGRKFARPGEITIRIGKPVRFDEARSAEEIVKELAAMVEGL
jgi:long-chain acyl-CoA synthetase